MSFNIFEYVDSDSKSIHSNSNMCRRKIDEGPAAETIAWGRSEPVGSGQSARVMQGRCEESHQTTRKSLNHLHTEKSMFLEGSSGLSTTPVHSTYCSRTPTILEVLDNFRSNATNHARQQNRLGRTPNMRRRSHIREGWQNKRAPTRAHLCSEQ